MNIEKKKTSPALFVRQVRQELQKVTWPQRRDTFISSAIVILLIILFSLFFLLTGCAPNFDTLEGEYVFNDPYYYGIIDQDVLKNHQNYKWFDKQYSQYNPNIEKLSKTNLEDIDIAIFMGTWCHDSKREVPRAIKLFNLLALDNERIKIVALNKQKKGYFKNYKSFNINRTPTIIFFKNGKEIGRIIERPSESIEENFFQFVDKNK